MSDYSKVYFAQEAEGSRSYPSAIIDRELSTVVGKLHCIGGDF